MTAEQQAKVLDVFKESGIYRTIGGANCRYTDEGFKEFLAENAGQRLTVSCCVGGFRLRVNWAFSPCQNTMERLKKPMEVLRDEFDFGIQDEDVCGIVNGELASKAFNKGKAVERLCELNGRKTAVCRAAGNFPAAFLRGKDRKEITGFMTLRLQSEWK